MQSVKKLLIVVMILAESTVLYAQNPLSRQGGTDAQRQAADLFEKEKYASAQHVYDEILAQNPKDAEACYYAAVCSAKLDNDDALYRLEEFMRLYPQSARCNMARFYKGNYHYARGEYAEALDSYKKVNSNEVDYGYRSEYDFKLGYSLFVNGYESQAKSCFSRLLTGQSKYKNSALYYYAHIQYMDREYELALKNFEKLQSDRKFARIVPNYIARIYYYLGREEDLLRIAPDLLEERDAYRRDEIAQMVAEVYFNRGDYRKALRYYEGVMSETPGAKSEGGDSKVCTPQDNYYQIGYCHYMLQNYDSAAVYLERKTACMDSVAQNALYTLGDTYVRLGRKNEARSMFLQASKMDFNEKIKEDALFNYAKLSCELNMNPYNESIRSFENYLKKYPKTTHRTEIQEILTSLYLTTRNYKDALSLIEKLPERNAALNQAYQRCLNNYGIELFHARKYKEASTYFAKSVKLNVMPRHTADANYLLGETQYRLGDYSSAAKNIDRFLLSSHASKSSYYAQGLYTSGYLNMRSEHYADAAENFNRFLQTEEGKAYSHQSYDVYNRLGDCSYVSREYQEAIEYYDRVITAVDKDADYATYQKAMCLGAMGKNPEKLVQLNYIFEKYKGSQYSSKAMLEIANTYMVCDNNDMALLYYGNFLKQYPNSAYVKEALLSRGLIYYNTGRDDDALASFDQLLTQYPGTDEARDALSTVKSIYIGQNRVDEYFAYVKKTTKTSISTVEQDSTTFMAAQSRYEEGEYEQAITSLENYLSHFPNGLFAVQAHYYLADSYFRTGLNENALPHYEAVAVTGKNKYTEKSLYNGANIAYSLGDYRKALSLYTQLMQTSEGDNSRLQSRIGVLRCNVKIGDRVSISHAADNLLSESKITEELKEEALICKARSYYADRLTDTAAMLYRQLTSSSNGDYNGEACYILAEILFDQQDLAGAEKAIESIVSDPHSDYWLAKSFILWADIYYARGNALQAKQTLQSIIDNYDGEELINVAIEKRNAILAAEAPEQQQEEQELIIDINEE